MLAITGTGFQPGAAVTVDGVACGSPTVAPTSITCSLPARPKVCGPVAVSVINPDMQSATTPTGAGGLSLRPAMVRFALPVNTAAPASPRRIRTADLNGDGKPDLITANRDAGNVSVFLNNGAGVSGSPTNYQSSGITSVFDVAVADVNGDNKLDLVTANSQNNNITVFLGTGSGTFMPGTSYAVGNPASMLALADVNGDNKPDVAVAASNDMKVGVMLNDGSGGFGTPTAVPLTRALNVIALADISGDGKPDLISTHTEQVLGVGSVSVRLGMGGASFGAAQNKDTGVGRPATPLVADVTGDGKVDVIVPNQTGGSVTILPGMGNGTFGGGILLTTAGQPEGVYVADVNSDGMPDVLSANGIGNSWSYYQGMGNGQFAAAAVMTGPTNPSSLVAVDLNGDGLVDVATSDLGGNAIGVNLQQCN